MKIMAKDFSTRSSLESFVQSNFGLTPDIKVGTTIEGKRSELETLHLTDRTMFWGIKCVITDTPTIDDTPHERIERGEQSDFGINIKS